MDKIYCDWAQQDVDELNNAGYYCELYEATAQQVLDDALASSDVFTALPRRSSRLVDLVSGYLRHEHTNYDALTIALTGKGRDAYDEHVRRRQAIRRSIYKRACRRWPELKIHEIGKLREAMMATA